MLQTILKDHVHQVILLTIPTIIKTIYLFGADKFITHKMYIRKKMAEYSTVIIYL